MPCDGRLVRTSKPSAKPSGGTDIGGFVEDLINEEYTTDGEARLRGPHAKAYPYTTKCSAGAYAEATTGEAAAEWSAFSARANGPRATTGVHAGVGGASAHANLELARAEAAAGPLKVGVGLNANTGASIGPEGVEASVLGFGVSVGPKLAIKTPVADLSCVVM